MSQSNKRELVQLERFPVSAEDEANMLGWLDEFIGRFRRGQLPVGNTARLMKELLNQEMPYSAPLMVAMEIAETLTDRSVLGEFYAWLAIYDVTECSDHLVRAMQALNRRLEECSNTRTQLGSLLASTAEMCYELALRRGFDLDRSGLELFERERSMRKLSSYEEYLYYKLLTLRDAYLLPVRTECASLSELIEKGQWGVYFLAIKKRLEKYVAISADDVFRWLNVQPNFAHEERAECLVLAMKKYPGVEQFRVLAEKALAEESCSFTKAILCVNFAETAADRESFEKAVRQIQLAIWGELRTLFSLRENILSSSLARAFGKMLRDGNIPTDQLDEIKRLVADKLYWWFNYAFKLALLSDGCLSREETFYSPRPQSHERTQLERILFHLIVAKSDGVLPNIMANEFELAYNGILFLRDAEPDVKVKLLCMLYRAMCDLGIDKQSRKEREKKQAAEKAAVGA